MKSSTLIVILMILTGLVLTPTALYAESGRQQTVAAPPVSQPLVREGTLAVKLAVALNLGKVSNEAEAESALSAVGIAPKNGWIADYPVTPDIIGELQSAVKAAADSKYISLTKEEALKAFQNVTATYDLPVKPSGKAVEEANAGTGESPQAYIPEESTMVNNYYYDEGPPVVTYYAPPVDYAYLYTWVPYPFWWSNFWFPGFYVLGDFDMDIGHGHFHHDRDFDHEFHHDRDFHHGRGRDRFITNHFRDPKTGAVTSIDPATRMHGGNSPARTNTGWSSVSARNGARSIFNQSVNRTNVNHAASGWRERVGSPSGNNWNMNRNSHTALWNRTPVSHGSNSLSTRPRGTFGNARPYSGGRTYTPSGGNRVYNTYRGGMFNSAGGARAFQPRTFEQRTFQPRTFAQRTFRPGTFEQRTFQARTFQPRVGGSFGGWHGGSSVRSFGGWHGGGGSVRSSGGWHGGGFGGRR